jgi:hypothetical protein
MSSIKLESNASGTGVFTIASPNSNTNRTLTLPNNTGTILTSATTVGFPAGSVLQVVNADYTTSNSTTSTSYVTGVTGSITTVAASSKIQIIATFGWNTNNANSFIKYERTIGGSTTALYTSSSWVLRNNNADLIDMIVPVNYLDSPAQSAGTAITYTISVNRGGGSGTVTTNASYTARIQFLEIAA